MLLSHHTNIPAASLQPSLLLGPLRGEGDASLLGPYCRGDVGQITAMTETLLIEYESCARVACRRSSTGS